MIHTLDADDIYVSSVGSSTEICDDAAVSHWRQFVPKRMRCWPQKFLKEIIFLWKTERGRTSLFSRAALWCVCFGAKLFNPENRKKSDRTCPGAAAADAAPLTLGVCSSRFKKSPEICEKLLKAFFHYTRCCFFFLEVFKIVSFQEE